MYKLIRVFGKYEAFMFLLGGQHRMNGVRGAHYCKPIGAEYLHALRSDDPKGEIISIALGEKCIKDAKTKMRYNVEKRAAGRYRSLNIIPWLAGRKQKREDTTVEFRIHRNTHDVDRVIGWAQLCACLVEWCHKASDKEIDELPKSAAQAFANIIAPSLKDWILNRIKGWRNDTSIKSGVPRRVRFRNGEYVMVPYGSLS
jgi:hypothetical protein